MGKYVSCGQFNSYYYYILLEFIFGLLKDSLYGFNYHNIFRDVKIISTPTQAYFSCHHLIHQIFNYLGIFIISIFLDKFEQKAFKREISPNSPDNKTKNIQIILIHNSISDVENNNYNFLMGLITIIIWVLEEQLINIYENALKDLDFWMLELLIITLFYEINFKIEIYKHQKFAILFNIIPCLLKIIVIFLSFFDDNKESEPILYNINRILIPIGISIYLVIIAFRSFVNTKLKWFMDLTYISHNKILRYYGIIGAIICFITSFIATFIKCNDNFKEIELMDYICKIPYKGKDRNENISDEKYLENFIFYFKTFLGKVNKRYAPIEILYEIIIIFCGMITFFFEKYFSILIIKYLTPVHLIFSIPIFYFFKKIALILYNLFINELYIHSSIDYILIKFIVDGTAEFLSFFGFLIYLEIIELNCAKLDHNTKFNIMRRSFDESYGIHEYISKPKIKKNSNNEEEYEEEESEIDMTLN